MLDACLVVRGNHHLGPVARGLVLKDHGDGSIVVSVGLFDGLGRGRGGHGVWLRRCAGGVLISCTAVILRI